MMLTMTPTMETGSNRSGLIGEQIDPSELFEPIRTVCRTDDKYSLFYFHPNSNGEDQSLPEKDSQVYPWPSLDDNDEVYSDDDHSPGNPNRDYEASTER